MTSIAGTSIAGTSIAGTVTAGTLIAGVDSSTQSTTVEVRDLGSGEVVSVTSAPHPVTTPPVSEQWPSTWWDAFRRAWAEAGAPTVAAIAVGGQQHGAVLLDGQGEVIRPALLWNDTRSAPDAEWLREQLPNGRSAWAEAVGSVPVAAFTVSKLSWVHRTEPGNWERLARVALPHDWLTSQLTGRFTTDRGDASGTGYWCPSTGEYRPDVLAVVDRERDWSEATPEVIAPDQAAGGWRNGDHEVVVGPGTGDNMAAALGLALAPGDAVISVGTSGTVFARSTVATADPTGAVAGFADAAGGFLPLVCTLNAAKVLDAVRRLLGVDREEFDRLALAGPSGGLTLLPYFDGERVPDRPDATGLLAGLRSDVSREQLARAAVEGVVCGLLDGLDELRRHAPVDGQVVITGGAARSAAVQQLFAGLCDRPVVLGATDQSVATGACVQAAAVYEGVTVEAIQQRWGLTTRVAIAGVEVDVDDVRGRYRLLADGSTR